MDLPQETSVTLFNGRHFNCEIIVLCVRWYVSYKLSYRDLVAIMAERNIDVTHTSILRWVQRYVPEFAKRWQRYARPVGTSWRVDETYIKIKGKWGYLYRAVDAAGETVDFFLSEHRDIAAAKRFLQQAVEKRGVPQKITVRSMSVSVPIASGAHRVRLSLFRAVGIPHDMRPAAARNWRQPRRRYSLCAADQSLSFPPMSAKSIRPQETKLSLCPSANDGEKRDAVAVGDKLRNVDRCDNWARNCGLRGCYSDSRLTSHTPS